MIGFFNTYTPEPVAFTVFGTEIMWYGILIALAIMTAVIICVKRSAKHDIPRDTVLDGVIICVPLGLIGARLYYVAFNWAYYSEDFLRIINIRHGGLAVHGGLIAAFLGVYIFCRVRKISPLNGLDLAVPCIVMAQSIGRWGNYFNSEAHGGPTELPWGIPVGGQLVHPTFLYESIWCFILFFILIYIDNRRTFEGRTFLAYGALYSFVRFFVEELRTDSLMLGTLKQAQVLSAAVFIVCIAAMFILGRRAKRTGRIFS